jgi:hypothetical protein
MELADVNDAALGRISHPSWYTKNDPQTVIAP